MNAVNQARASLPFRPTGRSTRAFESFATMSSPSPNVNDAPTRKAGNPPFFPITPGPRRHFPLLIGAAPLSNFTALHKLQKIQKLHKLHKTSKALWSRVSAMNPKHTNPFTATLGATPPLLVVGLPANRGHVVELPRG